jgi:TonB family protein
MIVHAPIELRRTRAGDAEAAAPTRGLSLAQRRILTLLDTPASLDDLARRHALEAPRLARDAARLREAGLIEDASAPPSVAAQAPVRLGPPPLARRLPLALLPLVAATIAWAAWQHLAPPVGSSNSRAERGAAAAPAAQGKVSAPPAAVDTPPIATRVLRGPAPERSQEPGKEARAAAKAPAPTEAKAAPATNALPIEPSPAPVVTSASPTQPGPLPAATSTPSSDPKPASATIATPTEPASAPDAAAAAATLTPAPVGAVPEPAAPSDNRPPRAPEPSPDSEAQVTHAPALQLASASPAAPSVRVPPAKLVPIAREAPGFPREAIAQGLSYGNVKARLTVDAQGRVASVDIVETTHRAFDRVVRESLAHWQFEPGASGRTTTVDVAFTRD